jgi:hypothetical protein
VLERRPDRDCTEGLLKAPRFWTTFWAQELRLSIRELEDGLK